MKGQLLKWFKNISIKRKLYFVVGIMALLIVIELFTLWFAIKTLSSVRAYVGGEGLWSKAQKDAVYYLQKYSNSHNQQDYLKFKEFLKVPLGDAKTREELIKQKPDLNNARQGFLEGHNHPDDIDGMIWLFRNFNKIYYIEKAIEIWGQAEPLAIQLIHIGEKMHMEINSEQPSQQKINEILIEIDLINKKLTSLEDEFSYTLGEGSRWLENLVLKILFLIAITVEFTGLFLTISLSITISRGINEIVMVSNRVAVGDFNSMAKIFSKDEIGSLANSFNNMITDLNQRVKERYEAEEALKCQKELLEDYAIKLERSNKDLEQFAYVASHDLKEPLRTITSYVQLLENRYKDKLDKDANEFIGFAVDGVKRMGGLIDYLLFYSQLNKTNVFYEWVDCADIIKDVLFVLGENIKMNQAKISADPMPLVYTNRAQIAQVFQNLINNAIKFRSSACPEIHISVKKEASCWLFAIKDNGIGIDKKYSDRIFNIFQRLHSRDKYEGTGIGLTICKKIIEQNGGKIWVKSELNHGATFYFTINNPDTQTMLNNLNE